jgi:hypothetical protein
MGALLPGARGSLSRLRCRQAAIKAAGVAPPAELGASYGRRIVLDSRYRSSTRSAYPAGAKAHHVKADPAHVSRQRGTQRRPFHRRSARRSGARHPRAQRHAEAALIMDANEAQKLQRENDYLKLRVAQLQGDVTDLSSQVMRLQQELERLHGRARAASLRDG